MDNSIFKELEVNVYTTVLIFDRQSYLIFRGDMENAVKIIEKLFKESEK